MTAIAILCLAALCAGMSDEPSEHEVGPAATAPERICIDLPEGSPAKKLCIVVTDEWRLNADAAVRQRRTIEGDTRVLETGAVIFDPSDPLLERAQSTIWPYLDQTLSPSMPLPPVYTQPVGAGIVGFEQITPYSVLVQYRPRADAPWADLTTEGLPIYAQLRFEWIAGGVNEGDIYPRNLARARREENYARGLPKEMDFLGRDVLGPVTIKEIPASKTALFEWFLLQRKQPVEGIAKADALYLVARQCGRAVKEGSWTDGNGCIPQVVYATRAKRQRSGPEVRVIPIPAAWERPDAEWQAENSSALVMPSRWIEDAGDALGTVPLDSTGVPATAVVPRAQYLDLPAQVLSPARPPQPIIDYLRERPTIAILRSDAIEAHPWHVLNIITGEELRQHERVKLRLKAPQRDLTEWRFFVFYRQAKGETWKRLSEPDGKGFTSLALSPKEDELAYEGERRRSGWFAAIQTGRVPLGASGQILILVPPPATVRGVRSPEENPWMPKGLNHSNWKWLVATTD